MDRIVGFKGEHRYLSNFWRAIVLFEGVAYMSAEHAYQAAKTKDAKERKQIAACKTAVEAKRAGKKLTMRDDWDAVKLEVMDTIVRDKFYRNATLAKLLIQTAPAEIIEENNWGDTFWGVCNGVGDNNLGKILMKVRAEQLAHKAGE